MRKACLVILALILLVPATALSADLKIGVVNVDKVLQSSEPGQDAMETLKTKYKGMSEKLAADKKELDTMREDMQAQSLVLSQQAKQDKEIEFRRKVRDFQDNLRDYQMKMKNEQEALSKPIIKTIVDSVRAYAEKNAYTMIMDSKSSGLVHADPSLDVTKAVIVEVNKAWREQHAKKQ